MSILFYCQIQDFCVDFRKKMTVQTDHARKILYTPTMPVPLTNTPAGNAKKEPARVFECLFNFSV